MQTTTATSSSTQAEQQLRAQVELLKNHDAESSAGSTGSDAQGTRSAQAFSHGTRSSNAYDQIAAASQDAARALAARSEADSFIHPDLRARPGQPQADTMMPIAPPSGHTPEPSPAGPSNTAIAPAPPPLSPHSGDGDGDDMKKYKRELSQTKRAAQNRAAQRAFRQRKETYIKKLEQQVRDYMEMEQSFKSLQSENYALREYILHLQDRMMDAMGEVPQPPPNVNLSQQSNAPPPSAVVQDTATGQPGAGTPLEAVAQAVAGLAAHEQMVERQDRYPSPLKVEGQEDTRTVEEINKQLQPDERGS